MENKVEIENGTKTANARIEEGRMENMKETKTREWLKTKEIVKRSRIDTNRRIWGVRYQYISEDAKDSTSRQDDYVNSSESIWTADKKKDEAMHEEKSKEKGDDKTRTEPPHHEKYDGTQTEGNNFDKGVEHGNRIHREVKLTPEKKQKSLEH